jgi:hypothetical protein
LTFSFLRRTLKLLNAHTKFFKELCVCACARARVFWLHRPLQLQAACIVLELPPITVSTCWLHVCC